eukprot:TRINITY_DN9279_c0_g1_i4.p1 TRINITY_DN9279_c0_g1~~TRINITY_DN9279_c0_g1_i4.p1  ORF type:complete len:130 (+),score=11.68 TRINITY_DN9279_c0_g1_i4:48-437(+)
MADVEMDGSSAAVQPAEASAEAQKKFTVKKWNAVALWQWDLVVDNCAICRNHIMDLCKLTFSSLLLRHIDKSEQVSNAKLIKPQPQATNVRSPGVCATTLSISIAFRGGSRRGRYALLTTQNGISKSKN